MYFMHHAYGSVIFLISVSVNSLSYGGADSNDNTHAALCYVISNNSNHNNNKTRNSISKDKVKLLAIIANNSPYIKDTIYKIAPIRHNIK